MIYKLKYICDGDIRSASLTVPKEIFDNWSDDVKDSTLTAVSNPTKRLIRSIICLIHW